MTTPDWYDQVKAVFDARGVPEEVWFPIMYAESGGRPDALHDSRGQDTPPGTRPEFSVGLFQINLLSRGVAADQLEGEKARLFDPVQNAQAAVGSIAAAWDAVKSVVSGGNASLWSGIVATRSGHPGGHPDSPCTSAHCQNAQNRIVGIAQQFITAGIAGFTLAVGGAIPAATGAVGSIGDAVSGATAGIKSVEELIGKLTDPEFLVRFIVFFVGLGLVFISAASVLFQPAASAALKVIKAVK